MDRRVFNQWTNPTSTPGESALLYRNWGEDLCSRSLWSFHPSISLMLQARTFLVTVVKHSFSLFEPSSEWFCSLPWSVKAGWAWVAFLPSSLSVKDCHKALLLLLFYSFHDDDDDDDELKRDAQNYDQKLNKATNTFKVYFIYKCVYVCV